MPAQSATNGTGAQLLTETYGVGPFHGGGGGGSGSGYNAGFDQGQSQDAGGWDNSGGSDNSGWGRGASDNNSGWGDFGGSVFGGGDWGGGDPSRASWEAVAQASGRRLQEPDLVRVAGAHLGDRHVPGLAGSVAVRTNRKPESDRAGSCCAAAGCPGARRIGE